MTKANFLAGLRVGWIVAPQNVTEKVLIHRDHDTISVGAINDNFAAIALENKKNILARSQKITRGNLTILDAWVTCQQRVSWVKPTAGKTAMLKVDLPMTTHAFCVDLLKPTSAMLTSGDAFDMDENVRNGYANGADVLEAGLDRIGAYLANF